MFFWKRRIIHRDSHVYEREWINDKANGKGKYIFADCFVNIRVWKDNLEDGFVIEIRPDGFINEGNYFFV